MGFLHARLSLLQSEIKSAALISLRVGPNPAAVFLHDALHSGQSHSSPFKVFCIVQSHEDSEELACQTWIEPDSVIAHKNDRFILGHVADLNHSRLSMAREFHRIGE